jgi:hypothetical protein
MNTNPNIHAAQSRRGGYDPIPSLEGKKLLEPDQQPAESFAATVGSPSHPLWHLDNVATFTHEYQPSRGSEGDAIVFTNYRWNPACVIRTRIYRGDPQIEFITDLDSGSLSVYFTTDAIQLEAIARNFLDAAHHLRQQASQGGAA